MSQQPSLFGVESFSRTDIVEHVYFVFETVITTNYVSLQKQKPFLPHAVQRTLITEGYCNKINTMWAVDADLFLSKIPKTRVYQPQHPQPQPQPQSLNPINPQPPTQSHELAPADCEALLLSAGEYSYKP